MPKYVIERELPGAGNLSQIELQGISQKSCDVLRELGPEINWVHSYVTDDKIYCVYIAPNEDPIYFALVLLPFSQSELIVEIVTPVSPWANCRNRVSSRT